MENLKVCLVCSRILPIYRFRAKYEFCNNCRAELIKLKHQVHSAIVMSVRYGIKSYIWNYLPYSLDDFKKNIEMQFEPWMNWKNQGKYNILDWNDNDQNTWYWQLDHIIPQSVYWFTSIKDDLFKECWGLDNIRPLSAKLNALKGSKLYGRYDEIKRLG